MGTVREKSKSGKRTAPELLTVLGKNGAVSKAKDPGIETETLLRIYRGMSFIRKLDERMLLMQRQGRIGFWGPTKGQEAATIASAAAFEDRDWIFPALREAGAALYRGLPLKDMFSQIFGNALDRTHGRQMPCHYSFPEGNFHAMSSVIGTQVPHAVGAAMAAKIKGDDVVMAGYLGDGATSSTDFHAAMNFAQVFRAPCVLICQNNHWAISVPLSKQTASETIAQKAVAYGMEGVRVDGNDALAVFAATRRAIEKARAGDGPTFLELVTYRVLGHSSSDDASRYRDESEVAEWEAKDPINRLRAHLDKLSAWDDELEEEMDGEIQAEIAQAVRDAEAGPPVDPETLITDVFAEVPAHLREHLDRTMRDLGA